MESKEIQIRLSENIKKYRKLAHLTQYQLAEMTNVSEDMIKSLEQGRTWCSEKTLSQITSALKIDVSELFMPVSSSFNNDENRRAEIKSLVAKNLREYVDEVLKEFDHQA